MTGPVHCVGCGLAAERCRGACGRATGPLRFCATCGRRLSEVVVVPGSVAAWCRDHGLVVGSVES